jgi:ubiquinone biosynthesis protein UbiJ
MLVAQLNAYLARALQRSPRATALCHALDGRRLRLEIEGLPGALGVTVSHGTLRAAQLPSAAGALDEVADVTVRGTALGLLALAGDDASGAVMGGRAQLEGEEALAQQFQELARLLRPDIEAAMGQVVGRMPAHLTIRALRLFAGWSRAAGESMARNAADYLAHESGDLVPRAEAESYFCGVEALRSSVTQAEARVARLAERLALLSARTPS